MKLYKICFSPTGGTQRAADLLAQGLSDEAVTVDLTDAGADFAAVPFRPEDVALIAVPSYGGRVPETAARRLETCRGNGARAVLVCVYGNRAYEDTLVELADTARQAGFRVIAAAAAVAEHSIARQFASGRPDAEDAKTLRDFAARIRKKLEEGAADMPQIPGNRPYKKAGGGGMVPGVSGDCDLCGRCARLCPVQAIPAADPRTTDAGRCISCMRCIAVCPRGARRLDPARLAAVGEMLQKVCSERRECELYL